MSKEKIFNISVGKSDCEDCEVCRLMEKAEKEGRELTSKELVDSMEKQGQKDGVYFYKK